jgi:hypothetical protein
MQFKYTVFMYCTYLILPVVLFDFFHLLYFQTLSRHISRWEGGLG